jgi:Sulfotransferase family
VFSFGALTRVFPDAMLVLAHRDPGHVLVSAARLTELLRAPFTTTIDRREIGRKVAECWQEGMLRMVRIADDSAFPCGSRTSRIARSSPIRLERSPGSTTRLASSSRRRRGRQWRRRSRRPNGGYGANRYRPDEFGIDPERERERASVYVERFGIAS